MPSIKAALRTLLAGDPAVAALVGAKIFPVVIPEGTVLPAITYRRMAGQRPFGSLEGSEGIAQPRFMVTGWAEDPTAAETVGAAIRQALDGYHTDAGVETAIYGIRLLDELDEFDEQALAYGDALEFLITYEED